MGYKAALLADLHPENTIYDAKRFIGKRFTKKELQLEAARYPFKVGERLNGRFRFDKILFPYI